MAHIRRINIAIDYVYKRAANVAVYNGISNTNAVHRHYHTQCDLSSYNNIYNKSVNLLKENQPCLCCTHSTVCTHTPTASTTQHTPYGAIYMHMQFTAINLYICDAKTCYSSWYCVQQCSPCTVYVILYII